MIRTIQLRGLIENGRMKAEWVFHLPTDYIEGVWVNEFTE